MRTFIPVPITLLMLFILAACETSNDGQEPSADGDAEQGLDDDRRLAANEPSLEGVEWHLTEISAPEEDVTSDELIRPVTLEFLPEDHQRETGARLVTGYGPCNSFSAAYLTEAEGEIRFSDIVSTRMACEEEVMRHERLLFDGLVNADAYDVDDSSLHIRSDSITLSYEAAQN